MVKTPVPKVRLSRAVGVTLDKVSAPICAPCAQIGGVQLESEPESPCASPGKPSPCKCAVPLWVPEFCRATKRAKHPSARASPPVVRCRVCRARRRPADADHMRCALFDPSANNGDQPRTLTLVFRRGNMPSSIAEPQALSNGVFGTTCPKKLAFPRGRPVPKTRSSLKLFWATRPNCGIQVNFWYPYSFVISVVATNFSRLTI